MYGQLEVDHKPGGRECTAVAVEYDALCEVVDVVVVDRPFGWRVVIQPKYDDILFHARELRRLGRSTA